MGELNWPHSRMRIPYLLEQAPRARLFESGSQCSFNQGLNFKPAIGFTSLKIDLDCQFWFTYLGFLGVYFINTLTDREYRKSSYKPPSTKKL